MNKEAQSTRSYIEQQPEFQTLLIFVEEYRRAYGISWEKLRTSSLQEGSCIAQGEGNNLLMAICSAQQWCAEWGELLYGDRQYAYLTLQLMYQALERHVARFAHLYPETIKELE